MQLLRMFLESRFGTQPLKQVLMSKAELECRRQIQLEIARRTSCHSYRNPYFRRGR